MRPEEEIRFLILGVQREGARTLATRLAPLGLTPAQAEALRCIGSHGPLSLKALGGLLVCESGSPSRLVETLVGRGIVARHEDAIDRRQVTLDLTSAGRALDRRVRLVEYQLYDEMGTLLGKTGIATALALLRPLAAGSISGAAISRRKAATEGEPAVSRRGRPSSGR